MAGDRVEGQRRHQRSDAREKTAVAPLTAAELAAAAELAREIGTFRFLAAIEAKVLVAHGLADLRPARARRPRVAAHEGVGERVEPVAAPLTAAELAAAAELAREIGTFRFLAAIEAKGEAPSARALSAAGFQSW
jgi:hypothetical protein